MKSNTKTENKMTKRQTQRQKKMTQRQKKMTQRHYARQTRKCFSKKAKDKWKLMEQRHEKRRRKKKFSDQNSQSSEDSSFLKLIKNMQAELTNIPNSIDNTLDLKSHLTDETSTVTDEETKKRRIQDPWKNLLDKSNSYAVYGDHVSLSEGNTSSTRGVYSDDEVFDQKKEEELSPNTIRLDKQMRNEQGMNKFF